MSCWVVPSIAAEFWQVPLEHVLDQLRRNALPVRRENGFTFIDILPDPTPGASLPPDQRPQTFTAAQPPVEPAREAPAPTVPARGAVRDCDWVSHNRIRLHTASLRRSPLAASPSDN